MNTNSLHRIYDRAMQELAAYEKCVLEGSDVEPALWFAKYLINSGTCDILIDNPETNPRFAKWHPYNGKELFAAADRLRILCGEYYSKRTSKTEGTPRGVPASELAQLNAKFDALASLVLTEKKRKRIRRVASKMLLLPDAVAAAAEG